MKKIILLSAMVLSIASCGVNTKLTMTNEEAALINGSPDIMRILTIDNDADLAVLRHSSTNFNVADLNTPEYAALARKLVKTLENTDGGVGPAAPQIGINRRVVAVQRVDKEGEPIEVYANIVIEEVRGEREAGPEGCLSVPGKRGEVMRYQDITIRYTDINSDRLDQPREIREDVSGFAAVIFQHECDHLDGVIYTDKAENVASDNDAATTESGVRHILMWTLAENLTAEQKLEVIKKAEASMKKFEKEIPGLLKANVIYQGRLESSNCDFMFDMLFENRKALEDFSVNPEHLAVVAELKPSISGRTCLDVAQ